MGGLQLYLTTWTWLYPYNSLYSAGHFESLSSTDFMFPVEDLWTVDLILEALFSTILLVYAFNSTHCNKDK